MRAYTLKKLIACLLSCLMLCALVACTDDDRKSEETTTKGNPENGATAGTTTAPSAHTPQSPAGDGEAIVLPEIPF